MFENTRNGIQALTLLMLMTSAYTAAGSGIIETSGFEEVTQYVDSLDAVFGPEAVLLVFDIDNTLLAGDHPLGTPEWFSWQDSLLTADSDSHLRACGDFQELLTLQGLIYSLGSMHLTEEDLPELVEQWQSEDHTCLVLSSREPTFNDATQHDLFAGGFDFSTSQPEVEPSFRGVHMPYSQDDMELSGLTLEEATMFDLTAPREIRFENGVMMVAGQHKGAMLLILLAHCSEYYPAVVFIDDNHENVERVFTALDGRGIEITAFRYGAEDSTVQAFDGEEKLETFEHLEDLEDTLEMVFPDPATP